MEQARKLRRYLRHGTMPQLAAFEAVYRLQSVTRAGEALHMAQPTVSGHLRKLSEAIGVTLFRCDGRRMLPTPAAIALHQAAQEVFGALERVDDVLAGMRAGAEPIAPQVAPNLPPQKATQAAAGAVPLQDQHGAEVIDIRKGRPDHQQVA